MLSEDHRARTHIPTADPRGRVGKLTGFWPGASTDQRLQTQHLRPLGALVGGSGNIRLPVRLFDGRPLSRRSPPAHCFAVRRGATCRVRPRPPPIAFAVLSGGGSYPAAGSRPAVRGPPSQPGRAGSLPAALAVAVCPPPFGGAAYEVASYATEVSGPHYYDLTHLGGQISMPAGCGTDADAPPGRSTVRFTLRPAVVSHTARPLVVGRGGMCGGAGRES